MTSVALTGATGFVGRVAMQRFLDAGWTVKALARNIPHAATHENLAWISGSLAQRQALEQLTKGADCVVHIAGAITAASRSDYLRINLEGTQHVLDAAVGNGVGRFIHISSLSARQPEISDYAFSKKRSEEHVLSQGNIPSLIIRPCAVYGEGDKATLPLLREFMKPSAMIPSLAHSRFSLIHVADLVDALLQAATSNRTGLVEVDDGHGGYVWSDLASVTQSHFGTPQRLRYLPRGLAMTAARGAEVLSRLTGKPPLATRGSISQLYHADWVVRNNGWNSANSMTLETGLLRTIAWYQSQGLLPKPSRSTARRQET